MKKILVTGANGQLGRCIQDASKNQAGLQFVFATKEGLDITEVDSIKAYFSKQGFDYCINTAAYTNVDQAEKETEAAFQINAEGAKNLADICAENDTTLIHISTDYVFDGEKESPYVETDATNPINVYGASKLKGEQFIRGICKKYYVLRTSWLYSQYGHNFLKTMQKHAIAGNPLTITTEQTGTPTNANDLARIILKIIHKDPKKYGVYHASNGGSTTWFGFAKEIVAQLGLTEKTTLAETDYYPTFAKRPKHSVLDTNKIEGLLKIKIYNWQKSLEISMQNLINRL